MQHDQQASPLPPDADARTPEDISEDQPLR